MLDIIVAHYNSRDFEKFLTPFLEHRITIYDKSGEYENDKFPNVTRLENVGRESETYLRHIIDNYDTLADYTMFIQDDTDNHIQYAYQFFYKTQDVVNSNTPFYQYETMWSKNNIIAKRLIHDGYLNLHTLPSQTSIRDFCKQFGVHLPKSYTTELCAYFIATRATIQARPKAFYEAVRAWLLENPKRGFVMEHVWKLIFSQSEVY
jgi:hypothetical protein